jgi:hypothetical protein
MHCCTYNGLIGYYYAWEGIVREKQGTAQVNLLLNRASPWLDVDSYLPYEGKVVIHNKTATRVVLRIPRWVKSQVVRSRLDGREIQPSWLGRCMLFDGLQPGNILTIEFPVVEVTETYQVGWEGIQIPGWTEVSRPLITETDRKPFTYVVSTGQVRPAELTTFTCQFRGNTLVDIQPREQGLGYPLYRRDHLRQNNTPMVEVTRSIPEKLIDL